MKVAKRLWLAGTILACGLPGVVLAQAQAEPGVYASLFLGSVDNSISKGEFGLSAQAVYDGFGIQTSVRNSPSLDNTDSSYGFAVGYRFNQWFAIEGGYVDLGEASYRETSTGRFLDNTGAPQGPPSDFTVRLKSNIAGFTFSALGVVPLTYRLEAYGRVGFLIGDDELEIDISNDTNGGSASFDVSENSTETMIGIGLAFSLVEIYSIRAEFTRILDAGKDDVSGEADIDLVSLGVTVRF